MAQTKPAFTPLERETVEDAAQLTRACFPGLFFQRSMADATLRGGVDQRSRQINAFKAGGFSVGSFDWDILNPTEKVGWFVGGPRVEESAPSRVACRTRRTSGGVQLAGCGFEPSCAAT